MNAGKCDPCAVVADGMIFILSSSLVFNFTVPGYTEKGMPIDNSIRFFECFDSESDKWMVLDDPPIDIPTLWRSSLLAEGVFSLLAVTQTVSGADSSRRYLYGLLGLHNNHILRSGLDQNPRMFSNLPIKTISMVQEFDSFDKLSCSSFILHLGNRRFYYLLTGSPSCGLGFPATILDDYSCAIKLFVFKETNCRPSEFYPKIVYSTSLEIKASFRISLTPYP
ncbi:hypothetical protein GH714_000538 [Hevea brasiliensis]|uniref:Uncharacterized protein n=1 Tax=Hevea brasiliensis TaxID=3981 RepID=A0A6A6MJ09_HEVBR|nr:hypothetical protein GH714_000538 [Hevea brasiliensis]